LFFETKLHENPGKFRLGTNAAFWPYVFVSGACMHYFSVRISVKVISGFGERDQGRKVVLRGQKIVA
jgi:hypothetical protein